ncbi:unnamed protein product [Penicillium salamii]|nr:unnamed protein product [Penicillium salamii]CAG8366275.1 unnamed protein product [Penicillium salamii]
MSYMAHEDLDWQSHFAQCEASGDILVLDPEASAMPFTDLCPNPFDFDLNLDAHLYREALTSASSFPDGATPTTAFAFPFNYESPTLDDSSGSMLNCPTLNYLSDHFPAQPPPTPPFAVPESGPMLWPTPPPAAATSCYAQQRPSCIVTATKSLHLLHIPEANCRSRQSGSRDNHTLNGAGQPRMSGSVLKCNKDAGMSVCRMLQCTCSLRPQNQLILGIICSKLIAWYRAMIQTYFVDCHGLNGVPEDMSEKVIHQLVTIGDHSVDDQRLGLTIQAQVTLRELHHMQRLVETLSARMQETANPIPSPASEIEAGTRFLSATVPEVAHDKLVAKLLRDVHAAKADLLTASQVL